MTDRNEPRWGWIAGNVQIATDEQKRILDMIYAGEFSQSDIDEIGDIRRWRRYRIDPGSESELIRIWGWADENTQAKQGE